MAISHRHKIILKNIDLILERTLRHPSRRDEYRSKDPRVRADEDAETKKVESFQKRVKSFLDQEEQMTAEPSDERSVLEEFAFFADKYQMRRIKGDRGVFYEWDGAKVITDNDAFDAFQFIATQCRSAGIDLPG